MTLRSLELPPRAPGLDRTMILLHGYGADEHDLLPLAHELDPRLRVVSLQAPLSLGGGMRAWFRLGQKPSGEITFDAGEVRAGLQAAALAVEAVAAKSPRPVLLGFSQGAAMAMGVLLTRPDLASAVLSLSGVPPLLEPRDLAPADRLRGLPLFAAHGLLDPLLPISLGRTLHEQMEKLGLEVEWHEYRMAHMVIPEELADARAWLQKRL